MKQRRAKLTEELDTITCTLDVFQAELLSQLMTLLRQATLEEVPNRGASIVINHYIHDSEWAARRTVQLLMRCANLISQPPNPTTGYYCYVLSKFIVNVAQRSSAVPCPHCCCFCCTCHRTRVHKCCAGFVGQGGH